MVSLRVQTLFTHLETHPVSYNCSVKRPFTVPVLGKGISPTLTIYDIAALGTIFNVLRYEAVLSRDSNLSPPRRRTDALRVELRSPVVETVLLNIAV